jgi:hypothetical protein
MSKSDKIQCDQCGNEASHSDLEELGWIQVFSGCTNNTGDIHMLHGPHRRIKSRFDFCSPQCFVAYVFSVPRYIIAKVEEE